MTIQDWGAIGEIIGGIAVVASLVYLAVQIRQNTHQITRQTEEQKHAMYERSTESGNRIRELLLLNPDIASIYARGAKDFRSLSQVEKSRFDLLMRNMLTEFQGAHLRMRAFAADDEKTDGGANKLSSVLKDAGVREWLASADVDFHPDFEQLLRENLARFDEAQEPSEDAE